MKTLSDLSKFTKIAILLPKNVSNSYRFMIATDDPDSWFISIITYRGKKLEFVSKETIIAKDLPDKIDTWLKSCKYKVLIRTNQKNSLVRKLIKRSFKNNV